MNETVVNSFSDGQLGDISEPRMGLTIGRNDKYLRLWFEVPFGGIGIGMNREEAKNVLESYLDFDSDIHTEFIEAMKVAIEALQNSSTGIWIDKKVNSYTRFVKCSNCEKNAPFIYKSRGDVYSACGTYGEFEKTNFCPNCGADMRGD